MKKPSRYQYLLFAGIVILLAVIGYSFYVFYPRFSLPVETGSGLILLAIVAGMASLFSPCSFPLLATLLAREVGTKSRRALVQAALAFTLGAMLFLMLVGMLLALGAGSVISQFTFTSVAGRILRGIVGVTLIGFGVWQVRGKTLSFVWLNRLLQPLWKKQTQMRRRRSILSYGLYGFGYILAGFG